MTNAVATNLFFLGGYVFVISFLRFAFTCLLPFPVLLPFRSPQSRSLNSSYSFGKVLKFRSKIQDGPAESWPQMHYWFILSQSACCKCCALSDEQIWRLLEMSCIFSAVCYTPSKMSSWLPGCDLQSRTHQFLLRAVILKYLLSCLVCATLSNTGVVLFIYAWLYVCIQLQPNGS